MIKSTALGLLGALTVAVPCSARVEHGTGDLLRLMASKGVNVVAPSQQCEQGNHGFFVRKSTGPEIHVCFQGAPTANAYDTVRHEAWHFLQSCVTPPGQSLLNPYFTNRNEYITFVQSNLSDVFISGITDNYDTRYHAAELEAFAGANAFTSSEIADKIRKSCKRV